MGRTPPADSVLSRRILFSLLHAGYLRHYAEPIRILAERGHEIHLVVGPAKDARDLLLVESLAAAHPTVSWERAPGRRYVDGWRRVAWFARAVGDLARYADPRYADAFGLRGRAAEQIRLKVLAQRFDPGSRRFLLRLVDRLETTSDANLARRWTHVAKSMEAAIPPSRRLVAYVRRRRPDAVVTSPLIEFASVQVEFLKAAEELGIPTGVCVASWDNLTNKGLMRVLADRVIVWNEAQRSEAVDLHAIPSDHVVITGAQRWDPWFDREPTRDKARFAAHVGLDPGRPYILYLCSSTFIAPDEAPFVRRWLDALRSAPDERVRGLAVLVRPHPQNAKQWDGVDLAGYGDVVVWPPGGAQPDDEEGQGDFFDSLAHAEVVVGINTSAMVESAILGKSVFTLLDPAFAATQEGTLHFHYLPADRGGFVHVARTFDEHVGQIAKALTNRTGDAERGRQFVAGFARPHGIDRPVAPIVADALEELASLGPRTPRRSSLGDVALRAALTPVAAALAAGAAGTWIALRIPGRRTTRLGRRLPSTVEERARRLERTRRWR